MSEPSYPREDEYIQVTTSLGAGKFGLSSLRGEETLSEPFHYKLELYTGATVAYAEMIGQPLSIKLSSTAGVRRYIHGLVTRVSLIRTDPVTHHSFFELDVRPWMWMLGLQADSKIYQNKTVPDIVEQLCKDAGYTDFTNKCIATYQPREYCVQYRETNLNFVKRLLEEEGIFFFFEHKEDKHSLVIGDDPSAHVPCTGMSSLRYRDNKTSVFEEDVLSECQLDQQVVSGAYGVGNYHFETPSTSLYTKTDGARAALAINDYPERHIKKDEGDTISKLRLEAQEFWAKLMRGGGELLSMMTGYNFALAEHSIAEFNGDWTIYSIRVDATREAYRLDFTAFPAAVPFRPWGTAERPIVASAQTAIVVGKSGEEQWYDKYGRVKLQFHWDRVGTKDENSSAWVRVAQGWAGKSWGMVFLPRIGQEVVVSFLEGDPDRPLVTGAVYNAEQMPPYTLPDEQTKSTVKSQTTKTGTGKFNELRFDDKAEAEEIYIHAQKDYNLLVENDVTRTIKHDETVAVTNDCKVTIDHDNVITVKNDRTRTVTEGNEKLTVSAGTRTVDIKGKETHDSHDDFAHTVDKNYTLTVKGDLTITVTGALSIEAASIAMKSKSGDVTIQSAAALTAKSATDATFQAGANGTVKAGANLDVKAGAALAAQGATMAVKGSASGEVDGGGMLTVKGGLVKIN